MSQASTHSPESVNPISCASPRSLESRSEHHLAKAILAAAAERAVAYSQPSDSVALPGLGISASVDAAEYIIGSHRLFHDRSLCTGDAHDRLAAAESEGYTIAVIGSAAAVIGFITIADEIRPESAAAVSQLRRAGISRIAMLTGDNESTARRIASETGIDEIHSGLLPEDKIATIRSIATSSDFTAMVGDGINDAPALAAADIGIALGGTATGTALETADIALMSDDLRKIPFAIDLSNSTMSVIRQNIVTALAIKAVFLVAAVSGMATLWMAVFADTGATIIVIANSLRLMRRRG